MREIKFRAWHKKARSMSPSQTLNQWLTAARDGTLPLDGSINFFMYTGLKDKNGVEIYEGDILKGKGVVIYNRDRFTTKPKPNSLVWAKNSINPVLDEAIGNIYENKELLK